MYVNICNLVVVTQLLECCSKKRYEGKEIAVEKKRVLRKSGLNLMVKIKIKKQ